MKDTISKINNSIYHLKDQVKSRQMNQKQIYENKY